MHLIITEKQFEVLSLALERYTRPDIVLKFKKSKDNLIKYGYCNLSMLESKEKVSIMAPFLTIDNCWVIYITKYEKDSATRKAIYVNCESGKVKIKTMSKANIIYKDLKES